MGTDGITELAAGIIGTIVLAFGVRIIFKESDSDRNRKDKTNGGFHHETHKAIREHIAYFKDLQYGYVIYTRKKKKANGIIKCIRFYKDIKFFEFDFLTLELLRYRNPKIRKWQIN